MEIPKTFRLIKQPEGSLVCGAAVCAIATGKSLDEVLGDCDWRTLTDMGGVALYLARHGITCGVWLEEWDGFPKSVTTEIDPAGRPAILSVDSATYENCQHWVFWDGMKILDPSPREQEKYRVDRVYFLSYWNSPEYLEKLDPDWRLQTAEAAGLKLI